MRNTPCREMAISNEAEDSTVPYSIVCMYVQHGTVQYSTAETRPAPHRAINRGGEGPIYVHLMYSTAPHCKERARHRK